MISIIDSESIFMGHIKIPSQDSELKEGVWNSIHGKDGFSNGMIS
jgi:hypothetical protein